VVILRGCWLVKEGGFHIAQFTSKTLRVLSKLASGMIWEDWLELRAMTGVGEGETRKVLEGLYLGLDSSRSWNDWNRKWNG